MSLMQGIDLKKIATKMGGASGAELKVSLSFLFFINFVWLCQFVSNETYEILFSLWEQVSLSR